MFTFFVTSYLAGRSFGRPAFVVKRKLYMKALDCEKRGERWLVNLQADSVGTMPNTMHDVPVLKDMVQAGDEAKFEVGSTMRVLTPFAIYFYGEDEQWHEAG